MEEKKLTTGEMTDDQLEQVASSVNQEERSDICPQCGGRLHSNAPTVQRDGAGIFTFV